MRCYPGEPLRTRTGRRTLGITLIETLLASTLGALLLIALLSLYQRSLATHAFAESRSELADTLFIAERILTDELHLAGRLPCGQSGVTANLVRTHQTTPWLHLFTAPVQITASAVPGSDELIVLKTGAPVPLVDHDPARAQFTLTHAADFERGDIAVVCDNDVTVLLQITNDHGRVLGYGHNARVRPGNCASPFGGGDCGPDNHRFDKGAVVAPYEPAVFFIADTDTGRTLSRKRLVSADSSNGAAARLLTERMIENLILLRVYAGIADSAGRIRLTHGPLNTRQAILLDVGLAATARERNVETPPDELLHLLGEPVDALLSVNPAAVARLLTSHEFTVAL